MIQAHPQQLQPPAGSSYFHIPANFHRARMIRLLLLVVALGHAISALPHAQRSSKIYHDMELLERLLELYNSKDKLESRDASLGCSPNPCLNAECVLGPDGQAFCECSGGQNGAFCNASSIGVNCEPSSDGDRYIYDQYGGYIQSPGYPEPYGIQQRCPYIIGFPGAERIEIRFENVDIDFSGANYLGYQPGGTIDFASEYVRLESLPSETIVVNDSKVSVFFQTTYANPSQKKGFRMHFRIYVDECRSSPCQNGVCFDEVDGFGCECSPGYEGTLCEINTDDCAIDPCQNGGVCVDDVNGFSCQCSLGYAGDQCETNINECGSNPCLNGAECVDGVNEFSCTCTAGFRGVLCKTENDDEEGEEQEEEEDEGSSDEDDDDD
ncbi:fibropellin-3-like [Patiria miniata]|uniref:Uncharacterized protein n=1 Tax=Patiria miniata TaxID=46514 RepID=A0A914ANI6_PATMI|nr:fibropellin-3-like [Patiria miniata]